jgi:hypothetical protein
MALLEITTLNKYGNPRKRIMFNPTTQLTIKNPTAYGRLFGVRVFKYDYEHAYMAPAIFTSPTNGKKYIIPAWIEVHPETTLADINWIKPEIKITEPKKTEWSFESSSGNGFYAVRYNSLGVLACNCMGYYRSKERKCKHVKQVENDLGKTENK